jgi:hypothetical protein
MNIGGRAVHSLFIIIGPSFTSVIKPVIVTAIKPRKIARKTYSKDVTNKKLKREEKRSRE